MIWVSHKYHLNHHAATDLSLVESDAWDCKSPAPPQDVNHALQTPEATMYTHVSTFTSALKPSRFEVLVLLGHSGTSHSSHLAFIDSVTIPNELQRQCSVYAVLQLWGHSHTGWSGTGLRLLWNWRKRCPDITYTSYTRVSKGCQRPPVQPSYYMQNGVRVDNQSLTRLLCLCTNLCTLEGQQNSRRQQGVYYYDDFQGTR